MPPEGQDVATGVLKIFGVKGVDGGVHWQAS
jgi:hypothetical protein